MKIKDVITAVRDKVNDPTGKYWSDVEVIRWISHHARMLFRNKAQADRSYGWHSYQILASQTDRIQEIKSDVWRYWLPDWIYTIYGVRELSRGVGERGTLIDYREHPRDGNAGWFWSTDRSIDLYQHNAALDIEVEVAKLPPVMHYGTIDSPCATRSEIRLDSNPVDGATPANAMEIDWQDDAYVGLEVEITSGSSETTNRRGFVTTIVSQNQVYDDQLTVPAWVVRCEVFPKWPSQPQIGDTYELHVPLSESNYEFISAKVARSLYHKTRNLDGIASVESVMVEGYDAYLAGLRPRQEQVPGFMVSPDGSPGHFNPDKDWSGEMLD